MSVTFLENFSAQTSETKRKLVAMQTGNSESIRQILQNSLPSDITLAQRFESFSENNLGLYALPIGVAPNFLINGKLYHIPMVTEESSVVAAASSSAKFWYKRGGFKSVVNGREKNGQVHFTSEAPSEYFDSISEQLQPRFYEELLPHVEGMESRGGGVKSWTIEHRPEVMPNYYRLDVRFGTADAMGANFINTCLEVMGRTLEQFVRENNPDSNTRVIMAILSNYNPGSTVTASVSCPVEEMITKGATPQEFSERLVMATRIACCDVHRAATHNKGIMNGIDALMIATGNDFRAIEAGAHAWAARDGQYRGLSEAHISDGVFHFSLTLPLTLGTVGGLTSLHPVAGAVLDILDNPSAEELMQIAAALGLAQNFTALRALTTLGIQKGHMRMHLGNILIGLNATREEHEKVSEWFNDNTVSLAAVRAYIEKLRENGAK